MKLLDTINSPEEIKKLGVEDLTLLAQELRDFILDTVSKTGGHLSSSLGVIELTIALHYVFDAPTDKIVWDVGHQAYAHKILTGRKDVFHTLRQSKGISGFPSRKESPYDAFGVGHSGTAISSALGMIVARDLSGQDNKVITVVGDGSMTAGISFEGLNQAGHLKKDLIVILNDNEMSISRNVGGLSLFLSRKYTGRFATKLKKEFETFFQSIPKIGEGLVSLAKRAEDSLVSLLTPGMLFEGLGFHYIGPLDGHNIEQLLKTFTDVKELKGPVLIHTLTKKGKGYPVAEKNPSKFHGVSKFDVKSGSTITAAKKTPTYTSVFGSTLVEIARENPKVLAITAAMPDGTGLQEFAQEHPDRFFDVGIAEQHAVTFAAGLATCGYVPVAAIYSTFLQRAYDQIIHDVALQNLHVVFALDRAGIVGADGPTHQGLFDLSYLRSIPHMVVMAPQDENELQHMLKTAIEHDGPIALRYPRGSGVGVTMSQTFKTLEIGKGEVLKEGDDLTIFAIGDAVIKALEASHKLEKDGIMASVVNSRFIKPLDRDLIISLCSKTKKAITVEENVLKGGFGSAILELLKEEGINDVTVKCLGISDVFVRQGAQDEIRSEFGIDSKSIEEASRKLLSWDVKEKKRAARQAFG
jgi:1-deoxy-D-xylulose-5-phosphate synthase